MEKFERAFGAWVIRFRWPILVLSVLWVFAVASGGRFLQFKTDYRVFFSKDNPQLLAFDALERTYTKNDNVLFVLTPKDANVFSPTTLAAVEALTEESWQIPYSIRVDSITNFQNTEAEGDDLIVADLVRDATQLDPEAIQKIKSIALNEPLLRGRLISPKGDVTGVNVTVQLPGKNPTGEVPETVSYSRDLAQRIMAQYPDIDVRTTGMVMMNNAFAESAQGDASTLVPMGYLVMAIALALLLRGFSATVGTIFVTAFSIVCGMGAGGYMGLPLTPPAMSALTIILTVAIANSVHILVSFLHEMRAGSTKNDALIESMRVNLQPVFLASVTTAIGFLTMNFSEVPPFRHLGNFTAAGVLASFVLAVTFLPALMSVLPVRVKVGEVKNDTSMVRFGEFVVAQRNRLLWGMLGLIIVLVAFVPRNELNDIFVQYFDESVSFRVDTDYATERLSGIYVFDYSLESGEPGGISEPDFLREVDAFSAWFREQPETMHVNVLTDTMKRLNKNMHGDDQSYYRLPQERELAAQYLLLYEMSLPYGLDLNNQINVDKSSTRMSITLRTMSTKEVLALEQRASDWLADNTRHITKSDGSGPTIMFAHIGMRNVISMLTGTTVALILISMILVIALRSIKIGLISMVPNLVPAAMGFGLWGILVGEIGLALSVVTGMTLGIVVDDTVHFLSKYLRARREKGFTSTAAVKYAFASVGKALWITSIVLIAGFLILSLSSFKLNSAMGMLSAMVIGFALLADFLFLPPLLMKLDGDRDEKKLDSNRDVRVASA